MKNIVLLILLLTSFTNISYGQNLESPASGKSLIYITRTSGVGALINFRYFDGDKYIGKFNGTNYVLYECDPGEHIFWANAENRDFVPAKLEADKTYIIHAAAQMGAMKARIKLLPIDKGDEKMMKRVNKLLSKKTPTNFKKEDLDQVNKDLEEYIKISLEKYAENLAKNKVYSKLTSDMYHISN